MTSVHNRMQRVVEEAIEQGRERGVQLAVYYRGELIVDVSAGVADVRTGMKVTGDTLFPVFSTTKGVAATVIHLLAERGKLDYEMKIADVWPEFAANGKADITLRHALTHTSAIPHIPAEVIGQYANDWDKICAAVANLVPEYEPGTRREYHPVTYGWLLGETARRVDGRDFSRIMREEICEPLGITDSMFVGIPDEVESRVAYLEETPPEEAQSAAEPLTLGDWMNRPEARRACMPASSGIMTARALARHYAALLPGGIDGIRLLPQSRIKLATEPLVTPDGEVHTQGLGYALGHEGSPNGPRMTAFGHVGHGGSYAFADPDHELAVAYTNNLYTPQSAGMHLAQELRRALGIED